MRIFRLVVILIECVLVSPMVFKFPQLFSILLLQLNNTLSKVQIGLTSILLIKVGQKKHRRNKKRFPNTNLTTPIYIFLRTIRLILEREIFIYLFAFLGAILGSQVSIHLYSVSLVNLIAFVDFRKELFSELKR